MDNAADVMEVSGRRAVALAEGHRKEIASSVDVEAVLARFTSRKAVVGVVGLGYVGLPLSLCACEAGFRVLGFDISAERVDALNRGHSPLHHIEATKIAAARGRERFAATTDPRRLGEADAVLICVPTPLGPHREPDLSFIEETSRMLAGVLRAGQLVVLESTTYPGTTRDVVKPILEASGLRSGTDFFLAYSPEREDPGNPDFETSRIPKVVSGDGEDALRLASALYGQFLSRTVPVSSLEAAEAVKLIENIFRAVNVALVNELKVVFAALAIDIFEVIDAAKTKPFGYMPFYPGPGLGGHCIPIDPFYLTWKAREIGICTRFIELAGEVNTRMPHYVIERLSGALNERFGRSLKGARVLILGLAYKKNVDDIRESPTLKIMQLLEERGASVAYHDPFVPEVPPSREHPEFAGRRSVALLPESLRDFDVALICTDHDGVDYRIVVECCPLVVDTRNACAHAGIAAASVVKA